MAVWKPCPRLSAAADLLELVEARQAVEIRQHDDLDAPVGRLVLGGVVRIGGTELAERDLLVVTLARERGIPVAVVLSGGYSTESWRIHADAIEGILTRFDRG